MKQLLDIALRRFFNSFIRKSGISIFAAVLVFGFNAAVSAFDYHGVFTLAYAMKNIKGEYDRIESRNRPELKYFGDFSDSYRESWLGYEGYISSRFDPGPFDNFWLDEKFRKRHRFFVNIGRTFEEREDHYGTVEGSLNDWERKHVREIDSSAAEGGSRIFITDSSSINFYLKYEDVTPSIETDRVTNDPGYRLVNEEEADLSRKIMTAGFGVNHFMRENLILSVVIEAGRREETWDGNGTLTLTDFTEYDEYDLTADYSGNDIRFETSAEAYSRNKNISLKAALFLTRMELEGDSFSDFADSPDAPGHYRKSQNTAGIDLGMDFFPNDNFLVGFFIYYERWSIERRERLHPEPIEWNFDADWEGTDLISGGRIGFIPSEFVVLDFTAGFRAYGWDRNEEETDNKRLVLATERGPAFSLSLRFKF